MSQSLTQNHIHIVFSTKHRKDLISDDISSLLFAYLRSVCESQKCYPDSIGGYRDHVHILCRLSKNIKLSRFVLEIKTASSKWMKLKRMVLGDFSWQSGYAAFSVAYGDVKRVCTYIENQRDHHANINFQDELRTLLNENEILYDERYLWTEASA